MSAYGADRLIEELTKLGYTVENVTGNDKNIYAVLRNYEIAVGKFQGRIIDLGLQTAADYPNSVHSAIHVKAAPQLYEPAENIQNVRNVQASQLGAEWRYWSKNFVWNAEKEKTARRLMARITTIFEHA